MGRQGKDVQMSFEWMQATVPATLHLEGGAVVPHLIGTRVFNFYDHKAGRIEETATRPQAPTMPVHDLDGGAAWWVRVRHDDDSTALLDQSRMCSIEYATARGWI
jgi:hypothetical protein